jgi:glycosyltransferase involved in cell wall biosynthesis
VRELEQRPATERLSGRRRVEPQHRSQRTDKKKDKAMKIAQLVLTLEIGGLERLAIDLAVAQQADGHEPLLYCLWQSGPLQAEAERAGIPVVLFGKSKGFSPRTVSEIRQRLERDRPDVLHTHNAMVHHYGVLAARLAKIPVVVNTRHGIGVLQSDRKTSLLFRSTLPWTDSVVMVSESTREFFAREQGVPYTKSRVILNGIQVEKFARQRARPGSVRPRFRFGTVGRLVEAKDHASLVRAFAQVIGRLPDATLEIVGEGPLRPQIERLVEELGLRGKVFLPGASADIPGFLQNLDAFVLSSLTEGLPVALLEAMSAGLPIVSTRIAGVPEVAPENTVAIFSTPGNPAELAASMVRMAENCDAVTMGSEACYLARRNFSIANVWAQYKALFRDLAIGRTRRPPSWNLAVPRD